MELTEAQRIELADLREELHKAEARLLEALSEVPPGHPMEDVAKADFAEADAEISALRARIKELENLYDQ